MKKYRIMAPILLFTVAVPSPTPLNAQEDHHQGGGTLVLSRSVYEGKASTITIGETLPLGCQGGLTGLTVQVPLIAGGTAGVVVPCGVATDNGEYPNTLGYAQRLDQRRFRRQLRRHFSQSSSITSPPMASCSEPFPSPPIKWSPASAQNRSWHSTAPLMAAPSPSWATGVAWDAEAQLSRPQGRTCSTYRRPTRRAFAIRPIRSSPRSRAIRWFPLPTIAPLPKWMTMATSSFTDGNAYSGDNGRAAIKAATASFTWSATTTPATSPRHRCRRPLTALLSQNATGAELLYPG